MLANGIWAEKCFRSLTTDWIAYGLMDSIVDTFFPLIDFIEAEADEIDAFLANPLRIEEDSIAPAPSSTCQSGSKFTTKARQVFSKIKPSWLEFRVAQFTQFFGVIKSSAIVTQREADLSRIGQSKPKNHNNNNKNSSSNAPKTLSTKALKGVNQDLYDRTKMLTRIAVSRKLVMGLSRLLVPKSDVVRGLRKRLRDEKNRLGSNEPGQRHDIGIYLGDLQGKFLLPESI